MIRVGLVGLLAFGCYRVASPFVVILDPVTLTP
jgi:hypothetical protein